MPNIGPAHAVYVVDKLSAIWNAIYGTSASGMGHGDGTFGASAKAQDMRNIVEGSTASIFADADIATVLAPTALNFVTQNLATTVFANTWASFLSQMDALAARASGVSVTINNLDSFMSWYNYGNGSSYWQCLAPPDYYWAYSAAKNGTAPSKKNLYYEIKQGVTYRGSTFTNAMAKFVGTGAGTGTTTLGSSAPSTHAGGFCWCNITVAITGSGLLTVTGLDQDGNAETWTGTISGSTAIQLTPQNRSYSLISQVSTVGVAAGVTGGTFYIESRAPSGRTNPPV